MIQSYVNQLNRLVVSSYKIMGFAVLGAIVAGMSFYLLTTGFYLLSSSWIVPSILNPNNDKVVQARFQYLEHRHTLSRLETELLEVQKQIQHLNLAQTLQKNLQQHLSRSLLVEQKRSSADLTRLKELLRDVPKANSKNSLAAQLSQGLISREEFLRVQQSQIFQQEKMAELQKKVDALQSSTAWLQEMNLLADSSFEKTVLALTERGAQDSESIDKEKDLVKSALTSSETAVQQVVLAKRQAYLEALINDFRVSLEQIANHPYVRASQSQVTMAFVPYDNLKSLREETQILGCYLEFFLCKRVGKVSRVLDGEVTARHPMNGRDLRGQMVEINVADTSWTKSRTLLIGF